VLEETGSYWTAAAVAENGAGAGWVARGEAGEVASNARKLKIRSYVPKRLIEPDAVLQVLEARIIAHGVKKRVHFDPLQNAFLLLVGPLKPD
jgi:hypothetical protein